MEQLDASDRDALERALLVAELRALEQHAYATELVSLTATFNMTEGARLGLHMNDWNVILTIDPGLRAHEEGTLRVGDRIIAVNDSSADGLRVKDLMPGLDRATFLVARRVVVPTDDTAYAPASAPCAAARTMMPSSASG